jgi:maleylpyruvate isomerase
MAAVTSADLSTRLTAMRASTSAMIADFDAQRWADTDMAAPIALPNWTRGHVLTHIARNADGIARALSGALRGEIVKRYPNGPEGRAADIEAGAGRPVLEQLADVRESADRLDRVFGAVADADAWNATADNRPSRSWIRARWQEVEVHRIDADSGYTVDRWPADFVALLLPRLADRLPDRARGPLRLDVTAAGSLNPELVGRVWVVPGQDAPEDPVDVRGPDWAVLAWLTGRTSTVGDAMTALPELGPWM